MSAIDPKWKLARMRGLARWGLVTTESDLPDDVSVLVRAVYEEQAQGVLEALCSFRAGYASVASDHVLRCIVYSANGHAGRVMKYIELAKKDWRDVITAVEYQYPDVRVRDRSEIEVMQRGGTIGRADSSAR